MSVSKLYLHSGAFSLGGKIVSSVAGLAIVWLITHIAGKDVFGEIMIAYALNFVLGAAIAAQFQTILMYHASRDHGKNLHRDKTGAALFFAFTIGLVFVALENLAAPHLSAFMGKPQLATWFSSLSWYVPAFAVNSILSNWYRARQDVPTMVMYFEIWPNLFRVALLTAILLQGQPPSMIPAAYIFPCLMAFGMLYVRDPVALRFNPRLFTLWDMHYSAQMMVGHLMSKSLGNVVIFFLGIFAPASVVADYSLAMKFGQFLNLPKLILSQIQMPRMGAQIENRQSMELSQEYEAVRSLSLAATILSAAFFILLLPYVFAGFGDFAGAYGIFLILAISSIILAGFGSAGNYLSIAGHARAAMLIHSAAFMTVFASVLLLVPGYGGMGAAMATVLGSLALMVLAAIAVYQKDGFNTITPSAILQMVFSSLILALAANGTLPGPTAALGLITLAGLGLLEARPALRLLLPF